jgi:serine phosphatase RsbU (regulator of sigma subunit)/predicted enzyme related to lactoylglutathione lyase
MPDRPLPHLRLLSVMVPVTDFEHSLAFYVQRLGFRLLHRITLPQGVRGGIVAPPDGSTMLVLVAGVTGRPVGAPTGVSFVTDDIAACYEAWRQRGVKFADAPQAVWLGARQAVFFDPDDNAFSLVEADTITRELEAERRTAAERLEAERLAARELSIATQVQAGLFPQRRPLVSTLDYAGVCLQARQVGGDYFDFLESGPGQLGIVVGDVSGKGIGAAMLMANLQASVRSQYARHARDLTALLASVNESFFEHTPASSYATLFLATYDDESRRLCFLNSGHPPAIVLRRDGTVETLDAAGPVLGLFEAWDGASRAVAIDEGDVLAIYSDGVTEALSEAGEEFGLARLIDTLRASSTRPAQEQLDRVVAAVQDFGHGAPQDDVTLVIARGVGRPV